MPIAPDLTVRETAALSQVPRTAIEKGLEAGVLRTVAAPARFRGGATRFLPIRAVAYFHALKAADLMDLPLRHKQAVWRHLACLEPMRLEAIEFAPGATLDLERLAARALRYAERYREARDRYIASDPEGGAPLVAGTRLTVHAVMGRLRDGDTVEDLAAQHPEVPPRAFAAAELYAKTHPLRGRPSGRLWRNVA